MKQETADRIKAARFAAYKLIGEGVREGTVTEEEAMISIVGFYVSSIKQAVEETKKRQVSNTVRAILDSGNDKGLMLDMITEGPKLTGHLLKCEKEAQDLVRECFGEDTNIMVLDWLGSRMDSLTERVTGVKECALEARKAFKADQK